MTGGIPRLGITGISGFSGLLRGRNWPPDIEVSETVKRLTPAAVLIDMAIWEADTAYVFGVLNGALGFERPVTIALCILPHQVRRARKFGADGLWVRGVDDAAALPRLTGDLLQQRREGKLKPRVPSTPL